MVGIKVEMKKEYIIIGISVIIFALCIIFLSVFTDNVLSKLQLISGAMILLNFGILAFIVGLLRMRTAKLMDKRIGEQIRKPNPQCPICGNFMNPGCTNNNLKKFDMYSCIRCEVEYKMGG